jgi:hypothetical protein
MQSFREPESYYQLDLWQRKELILQLAFQACNCIT